MSTPVHGCSQLRFHSGPGRMFPAIVRHEPGEDSRQGAILTEQSKSATAEDPPFISTFMGFGC